MTRDQLHHESLAAKACAVRVAHVAARDLRAIEARRLLLEASRLLAEAVASSPCRAGCVGEREVCVARGCEWYRGVER